MNDFQKTRQADTFEIARRLTEYKGDRFATLSIYKGLEAFRETRVSVDAGVEVLIGNDWHTAYVDPSGFRDLIVRGA